MADSEAGSCSDVAHAKAPVNAPAMLQPSGLRYDVCEEAALEQQPHAASEQPASNRVWQQLTPDLAERVVSFLAASEVTATVRLVCRAAAAQFKAGRLRLSEPGGLPHHAFAMRWGPAGSSEGGHGTSSPRHPLGLQSRGIRSLTLASRRRLLELTAAGGDVCNLALAASVAGCGLPPGALEAALEGGRLTAATWLLDKGCPMKPCDMLIRCAKGGSVQAMRWVLALPEVLEPHAGAYLYLPSALQAAARAGHGEVCTALMDWVAGMAAEGNTRAAELIANGLWHLARQMAPVEAAAGGHPRLLFVLLAGVPTAEVGADWQRGLLKAVAGGCDLATLRKVHAVVCAPPRGPPPPPRAPAGQAAVGRRGRHGRGPQPDVLFERERQRQEQEVRARQAHMEALGAAARSTTPDWKDKVQWLQAPAQMAAVGRGINGRSSGSLDGSGVDVHVEGVAALPDAEERLRWLQARGFRLGRQALPEALRQCRELSVEALRYLLQSISPQDRSLLRTHLPLVAAAGRLDLLQELLEASSAAQPSPPTGQQAELQQEAPAPLAQVDHGDAVAVSSAAAAAAPAPPAPGAGAGPGDEAAALKPRWPSVSLDTVRQLLLAAVPEGHIEVVRWLLALAEQSLPLPQDGQADEGAAAVAVAAGPGARSGGQCGSGSDSGAVAEAGSSSEVEYAPPPLVQAGVLDSAVFCEAVRSGCMPLLALLRGAGCPWRPPAVWEAAAVAGCCDVLHWLAEHGCPLPANDEGNLFLRAARNVDELTIHTLRELGLAWAPRNETLSRGVQDYGVPLEGLAALVAAGCPADWPALLQLAQRHRNYGRRAGQESEVVAWVRGQLKKEQRQAQAAEERLAASKKGKGVGGAAGGAGGADGSGEAAGAERGGAKGKERKGRKGRKGRGHRRGGSDSSDENEGEVKPAAAHSRGQAAARNQ